MKILAIDLGTKKTGLALGDTEARVAVPFGCLREEKNTIDHIVAMAQEEGIEGFIVGVATAEGRQKNDQTQRTLQFINALEEKTGKQVFRVDEQFSSKEAQRIQDEYGSKITEDELAAMIVLQAWLDE